MPSQFGTPIHTVPSLPSSNTQAAKEHAPIVFFYVIPHPAYQEYKQAPDLREDRVNNRLDSALTNRGALGPTNLDTPFNYVVVHGIGLLTNFRGLPRRPLLA